MDARDQRIVHDGSTSTNVASPETAAPSPETGVVGLADAARPPRLTRTGAREIFRRLMRTRTGRIGFVLMSFYVLAAIFGSFVAPYSANEMDFLHRLEGPSSTHLFGTDQFGRDMLSRVLIGTRYILPLAVAATAVGVAGGVIVGMTAGYYGRRFDEITMRIVDGLMSFPSLVLALLIVSVFGSSFATLLLAIGVVFIPRVARIVRAATLDVKNREFVEAARLRGERATYIIFREILPNISAPVTVESAIRMSYAILLTASLSFLGLGAQPPTPDWGLMIAQSRQFIHDAPWTIIFPAVAISGLVIAANLLADGIREVLSYSGEEAQS